MVAGVAYRKGPLRAATVREPVSTQPVRPSQVAIRILAGVATFGSPRPTAPKSCG